jgi:putative DNA primase/helicase
MGYCLSPTNVAQTASFITGNGGEGKSIIIQVMQKILGRNQMTGQIHKLSTNNFMLSNLENKLAFLDDDINLAALDDTSIFKQIVTNNGEMMVERKNKQAHAAQIYAKILACGNGSLRSKYDKSDGFYRRLMIIKCLPKDRDRVDDKLLHVKILEETNGIFQWMLEGLQRLMGNGWYFSKCDGLEKNIEELKDEIENIRIFLKDSEYVKSSQVITTDGECLVSTTNEIVDCYMIWCEDNGYDAMNKRKISLFLSKHQAEFDIQATNKVIRNGVSRRGYRFIHMKKATLNGSGNVKLVRRDGNK